MVDREHQSLGSARGSPTATTLYRPTGDGSEDVTKGSGQSRDAMSRGYAEAAIAATSPVPALTIHAAHVSPGDLWVGS